MADTSRDKPAPSALSSASLMLHSRRKPRVRSVGDRAEIPAFLRSKHGVYEQFQVAGSGQFLHVHAQPSPAGEGNQPVASAVAHVEADFSRRAAHQRERLAELPGHDGEFVVLASQAARRGRREARPAQGIAPGRCGLQESAPAGLLVRRSAKRRLRPLGRRLASGLREQSTRRPSSRAHRRAPTTSPFLRPTRNSWRPYRAGKTP